ncbi:MAG: hypothetical protein J2P50_16000 [Hyphomicrobiaceae bacterium]|nr:hypothetical protein [Hyphomicrobiaceae bacterium]
MSAANPAFQIPCFQPIQHFVVSVGVAAAGLSSWRAGVHTSLVASTRERLVDVLIYRDTAPDATQTSSGLQDGHY